MVDLRSDTVTRPDPAMREAMAQAPVGDDVYGEDHTVRSLEERVAALLGHQAGLFTPSGSMANVLGVAMHVAPGQEMLCDSLAHVVRAELGAHAAMMGVTTRTWSAYAADSDTPVGLLDPELVADFAHPKAGPYLVSTAVVVVENTHNFGGGVVQPLAALERVRSWSARHGIAVHIDGARLWNAHVASGVPLSQYGANADTVSVCLSKGLGAPVGSVLVGERETIERARVWRKRLGGGMRQAGILAAAGHYALDHHVERLADDHRLASRIAHAAAQALPGCTIPEHAHTNICVLTLDNAPAVAERCRAQGILLSVLGPRTLRAVTHLDVNESQVDRAIAVLSEELSRLATERG